MMMETLLHIDETLSAVEEHALLEAMGNSELGMHAQHHSNKEHLLFVAYDSERMHPHDVVSIANERGYHAQLIDL